MAHDVIAEVVEGDTSAARRTVLHGRIAAALEDTAGDLPVELLAYHYEAAGDEEKTLLYLEQAGDRAWNRFAHATAETYYRDALNRLDSIVRPGAAAAIRQKLGEVLIGIGRWTEAIDVLNRAVEEARTAGDLEREGAITAALGDALYLIGRPGEGLALIRPLVAALETRGPSAGLLKAVTALARLSLVTTDVAGERAAIARAREVAGAIGDLRALDLLERQWRYHGWLFGEHNDTPGILEETLQAIKRDRANGDLPSLHRALHQAAWIYFFAGDLAACRMHSEQLVDVVRRMGDPVELTVRLSHLSNTLRLMGELQQSRSCLEEAESIRSSLPDPTAHDEFSLEWGMLALQEGDWDAAARHLDNAVRAAEQSVRWDFFPWAQFHRALLDLRRGQPNEALVRLTPLAQGSVGHAVGAVPVMWALASAYLDAGDDRQAEVWATRSVEQAVELRNMLDLPVALRVRGRVFTAQRRWQEAGQSFEEALALLQRIQIPEALAETLCEYAQLKAATGDRAGALRSLLEAQRIFTEIGTRDAVERTERALTDVRLVGAHEGAATFHGADRDNSPQTADARPVPSPGSSGAPASQISEASG
jgi:tetratricopeptide (TPR) repeat protein